MLNLNEETYPNGVPLKDIILLKKEDICVNDIILLPDYIDFSVTDVNLETKIDDIVLSKPYIVDCVNNELTAWQACKFALAGSLPVLHANNMEVWEELDCILNNISNEAIRVDIDASNRHDLEYYERFQHSDFDKAVPKVSDKILNKNINLFVKNENICNDKAKKIVLSCMGPYLNLEHVIWEYSNYVDFLVYTSFQTFEARISRKDIIYENIQPFSTLTKNLDLVFASKVSIEDTSCLELCSNSIKKGANVIILESDGTSDVEYESSIIASLKKDKIVVISSCQNNIDNILKLKESNVDLITLNITETESQAYLLYTLFSEYNIKTYITGDFKTLANMLKYLCLGASVLSINETKQSVSLKGTEGSLLETDQSLANIEDWLYYKYTAAQHGMQDIGLKSLNEISEALNIGKLKAEIRTHNGVAEGKVSVACPSECTGVN